MDGIPERKRGWQAVRAVFMGTPEFALPVLQALLDLKAEVVGVYTRPDKPKGRGLEVDAPPAKAFALERGLPVFQPVGLRNPVAQAEMAALKPDVVVVAAYGRILPPEVLSLPPKGVVNVHPSLLPRYRGPSPVVTALLDGVDVTGVSLMLLDEGMDSGPVLVQREERVLSDDTAATLTDRLFRAGADLLKSTLPAWMNGDIAPKPQDPSKATVTKLITREDGEADWGLPAGTLHRKLRAFTPWPGLYTRWKGRVLHIRDAAPLDGEAEPGLVVTLQNAAAPVGVGTGSGILGLKSLLLEGKKELPAKEFLLGYRDFPGSKLPG